MVTVSEAENQGPTGIGGWLVFPVIVSIIAPIFQAYAGINDFVAAPQVMSRVRSTVYLDGMLSFLLAAGWAYCCYLLFQRSRKFPMLFIGLLAGGVAKIVLSAFLLASQGANIAPMGSDFMKALVPLVLWAPYVARSKRVARTFTRE